MSSYARSETRPITQPMPQPPPDEPGLRMRDVGATNGNAAIGHHIRQQNRYYRQVVRKYAREHTAAQIIRALSMLVFSTGIVAALLISLTVLLPRFRPDPPAQPQPGPALSPAAYPTATAVPSQTPDTNPPEDPPAQAPRKTRPTPDPALTTSQHIYTPFYYEGGFF